MYRTYIDLASKLRYLVVFIVVYSMHFVRLDLQNAV